VEAIWATMDEDLLSGFDAAERDLLARLLRSFPR
jgi:hypothetical protein